MEIINNVFTERYNMVNSFWDETEELREKEAEVLQAFTDYVAEGKGGATSDDLERFMKNFEL